MYLKLRAEKVANTAKIATLRPEMMQRAQNKSDFRFYCIFKNYVKRAFWTYTVCPTNSLSRGEVGGWGRDPKKCTGEIGGWGRVPFNEPYALSLSTIYDGA